MEATHYWLFAREYLIWNATVTAPQFWTADLETHIISNAIRMSLHTFLLQQLSTATTEPARRNTIQSLCDHIKWHFWKRTCKRKMTAMKVRSESLNIPTPLRMSTTWIYHISTSENLSFDPTTPLTTAEQHPEHYPQRFRKTAAQYAIAVWCLPALKMRSLQEPSDPHLWHCSTCQITAHSREEQTSPSPLPAPQ